MKIVSVLVLALVATVLLSTSQGVAGVERRSRHRHRHRVEYDDDAEEAPAAAAAAAVPPMMGAIPPPPLSPEMIAKMAAQAGDGDAAATDADAAAAAAAAAPGAGAGNVMDQLMRFLAKPGKKGKGGKGGKGGNWKPSLFNANVNKDLISNVYGLITKTRDETVKDTAALEREKAETRKKQADMESQAEALRVRQAMLTRLQYCLEQDGGKGSESAAKQPAPAAGAVQAQPVIPKNATQAGRADAAAAQAAKEKALNQREAELNKRQKELERREEALRKRLEELKNKENDLRAKMNNANNNKGEGGNAAAAARKVKDLEAKVADLTKKLAKCQNKKPPVQGKHKDNFKAAAANMTQPQCPLQQLPCSAMRECGACTANHKCGWCKSSKKCLDIDTLGQSKKCAPEMLNHLFCDDHECSQHKTCSACMADPRCGKCGGKGSKCQRGDRAGPASGTCDAWNFGGPPSGLRFFSLNIFGKDTVNATERAKVIFKLIQEAEADFVALQEVEDWFIEALATQEWARHYHSSDFGSGHAPGGLLILSKIPLGSVAYYEKTQPGQVEVDQRGRLLAVRPKIGGQNLIVASTTLDWRSAESRVDGLEFVTSVLNVTEDAVLMGDLNFDAFAQPESSALPLAYKDLWQVLRPTQPGYTWDPTTNHYASTADPQSRPSRIDRILVNSKHWKPRKIDVIGSNEVSPHYGVLAEASLFGAYCW
eukprot:TRINITY_DN65816_c5_g4_i1.p1 TRINITY_DN65816_c5_g4~~TRINITY_DN65816_c5_g4_i1.p1  ORF type:complete len:724 (-),score=456.41 TRINITY_DN65816_c5_g4_i1:241-2373(-)